MERRAESDEEISAAQSFPHHKTAINMPQKNPNKQRSRVKLNNLYILKLNQHQTFKMQRVEEKEGNVGCGGDFLRTEMKGTSGPSSLSGELSHVVASPDHRNGLLLHSLIPSGKVALIMSDSSIILFHIDTM